MKSVKMMIQIALLIFISYLLNFLNSSQSSQRHHSKNKITSQEKSHNNLKKLSCWSTHLKIIFFQSAFVFYSDLDFISSVTNTAFLFFLFYLNFISFQFYCSFIQFFHALAAFYCHQEQQHFFKRDICYEYSAVTASS